MFGSAENCNTSTYSSYFFFLIFWLAPQGCVNFLPQLNGGAWGAEGEQTLSRGLPYLNWSSPTVICLFCSLLLTLQITKSGPTINVIYMMESLKFVKESHAIIVSRI